MTLWYTCWNKYYSTVGFSFIM